MWIAQFAYDATPVMPWYVRNFHIYKEIDIPRLNDFMHCLNLNFPLALENIGNGALNTFVEHDHNNPVNRKRPKTDTHLNNHPLIFFLCY